MTSFGLILRSLRHHWRTHLGVAAGAAIGTAVLAGALLVGDSVRASLRRLAEARLGRVDAALLGGDRFFRASMAGAISTNAQLPATAILQLAGVATTGDGSARANRVVVTGVSPDFWSFGPAPGVAQAGEIPADAVWLNETLAGQLRVKVGEMVVLRVPKPSLLSRDAPLSPTEDTSVALRVTVGRILRADDFGRFGFQATQLPPLNAFLSLVALQNKLSLTNQANGLIASFSTVEAGDVSTNGLVKLDQAFRTHATLADLGLQMLALPTGQAELRTPRVFLDSPAVAAAQATGFVPIPVLTYFANELRVGSKTTPYSMVTALPPVEDQAAVPANFATSLLPPDFPDDAVVINSWLAEDLQARPGDELEMSYYVVGTGRQLVEQRSKFRVHSIAPISGAAGDRTLMPDFPGMSNAENCRDWDTGFPIKTEAIRDKDEAYWKKYRGAPKAFVTLKAGQKMWANRFGNLTALRFNADITTIEPLLREALDPAALGLVFTDVRAQARDASAQGQDFGQLFLGFSFFLIVSALLLMALLFRFSLEQRGPEMGTLLALGFTPSRVRSLLLTEGALLSLLGGLPGLAGAVVYARLMIHGLSTIWRSAVGGGDLFYQARPATLLTGALVSVVLATATVFWSVRREARRPARELLQESGGAQGEMPVAGRGRLALWTAGVCFILALVVTGYGLTRSGSADAETFFSGASLVLVAGILLATFLLRRTGGAASDPGLTFMRLGLRNVSRRVGRSRAIFALLASGSFLIASIGVFRLDATSDAHLRSSGTGGFSALGESALPIIHDLNTQAGRDAYNLDAKLLTNVSVIPFRLREGDDASCLNLNRAQKPRLLGVNAALLAQRNAFTFAGVETASTNHPWLLLNQSMSDGEIPAIADANSIQWAMGKKLGDVIPYTDEHGRSVRLRLVGAVANSVLQGVVIVSEQNFIKLFPSESGYRFFLLDLQSNGGGPSAAISASAVEVTRHLTKSLQDLGLELTPAVERLNALNAVQNTYLSTFQLLGGLGLILGSAGLGIVVLRNVLERRNELGLLQAVGVSHQKVLGLVLGEHGLLLGAGLLLGMAAALVAVLPAVLAPGAHVPVASLTLTLAGVGIFGAISAYAATLYALRGNLIEALREE